MVDNQQSRLVQVTDRARVKVSDVLAKENGSMGRPAPRDLRKRLKNGRLELWAAHNSGASGPEIGRGLTSLVDSLVLDVYNEAALEVLRGAAESAPWCLIAVGGYGRCDLAPFSDVDLMLLYDAAEEKRSQELAGLVTRALIDGGLQLGFSLRTAAQAFELAWTDATVLTSLVESRFVAGNRELFDEFWSDFKAEAARRAKRLIPCIEAARREERRKYGETVYLLEPNVKRSRGGLRDVQLVRWLGLVRWGTKEFSELVERDALPREDVEDLQRGYEYLLRIRNQMHFECNKAHDRLDRVLQMKLAEWAGCRGKEGMHPVEEFMREYFEHTSGIRYASAHMLSNVNAQLSLRQVWTRTVARTISWPVRRDFRVGLRYVWPTEAGLERVKRDPAAVLELMSVASSHGKLIDPTTWREIRTAMRHRQIRDIDPLTIEKFLALMAQSNNLAEQLRRLHELRVLEQIIPAMQHARCLLQFNQYHKYTVDAHSIRAVECVTELEQDQYSLLGSIYRSLPDKTILHLALLLHDLGKGYPGDHSEVGAQIAAETADRLRLNDQDKETLVFLVRHHLLMVHTAFRYDLNAPETSLRFAAVVGSSERLELLLLLSYADLASVGPGVVNEWKIDLLLQLYYQTDAHFRDERPGEGFKQEIEKRRDLVRERRPAAIPETWWDEQVKMLPAGYLMRTPAARVADELAKLKSLDTQRCLIWGTPRPQQNALELVIAARQASLPIGTFHRVTGALTSNGLDILAAEIHTQPDNIAWDRFLVQDTKFDGVPSQKRIEEICKVLEKALDPNSPAPAFSKVWQSHSQRAADAVQESSEEVSRVRFDNTTSERNTIITVFTYDRIGLLYSIAKTLYELKLVLHAAKISTHLDQVVDVFYVTDINGEKITETTQLYMIRQRLLQAIEQTTAR